MSDSFDDRRIFLIALPSPDSCKEIEASISTSFSHLTFFAANDGNEALGKMDNVPPHVLILTKDLGRVDGYRLVESIINQKKFQETAIIFIEDPPDEQIFVDEVVEGRVQFLGSKPDANKLNRATSRALNFVSSHQPREFHLRFLTNGEQLIRQGDTAELVYLVRTGKLEAVHKNGNGHVFLGNILAGEFVGEMAYINGEPRSADVHALSNCELIEIPVDSLDAYLYRKPAWARALMYTLSKRLKKLNIERIEDAE